MLLSSPPSLSWGWLNQSLLEIFKFLLSLVFTLIRLVNKQNPIIAQIKNLQIETSIKLCGQWAHWELPSLFPIPHNNIPNRPTKPDPLFWKAQLINHSSRPKLFFLGDNFPFFIAHIIHILRLQQINWIKYTQTHFTFFSGGNGYSNPQRFLQNPTLTLT